MEARLPMGSSVGHCTQQDFLLNHCLDQKEGLRGGFICLGTLSQGETDPFLKDQQGDGRLQPAMERREGTYPA